MTTTAKKNTTLLIFHRSKQHPEKTMLDQKEFLLSYDENFSFSESIKEVIDYETGNYAKTSKIKQLVTDLDYSKGIVVIINSHLSAREYEEQYDMSSYFDNLNKIGRVDLYLMDSYGRLYKEVKNLKDVLR